MGKVQKYNLFNLNTVLINQLFFVPRPVSFSQNGLFSSHQTKLLSFMFLLRFFFHEERRFEQDSMSAFFSPQGSQPGNMCGIQQSSRCGRNMLYSATNPRKILCCWYQTAPRLIIYQNSVTHNWRSKLLRPFGCSRCVTGLRNKICT